MSILQNLVAASQLNESVLRDAPRDKHGPACAIISGYICCFM